jgi:Flp pilus assembly protein TadG
MRRTLRRRGHGEAGQALLEFAVVVPIFLILIFGIVDFGMGFKAYIAVTNATREGARFGAVGWPAGAYPSDCNSSGDDDLTVVARTCSSLAANVSSVENVSVTYEERNAVTGIQTGDSVVVTMTYRYNFMTPLGAMLSTFTGGHIPDTVTMESTADMRLE